MLHVLLGFRMCFYMRDHLASLALTPSLLRWSPLSVECRRVGTIILRDWLWPTLMIWDDPSSWISLSKPRHASWLGRIHRWANHQCLPRIFQGHFPAGVLTCADSDCLHAIKAATETHARHTIITLRGQCFPLSSRCYNFMRPQCDIYYRSIHPSQPHKLCQSDIWEWSWLEIRRALNLMVELHVHNFSFDQIQHVKLKGMIVYWNYHRHKHPSRIKLLIAFAGGQPLRQLTPAVSSRRKQNWKVLR